jgi:hypothetical protein
MRGGVIAELFAASGSIYRRAGALSAGITMQHAPNRYVDENNQVRNFYQSGRNMQGKIAGASPVADFQKNRFVFVLAERESQQYAVWRAALPSWITEPEAPVWLQPRILFRRACRNYCSALSLMEMLWTTTPHKSS